MSELTLEKMDLINFLLTEVSLELLGNQFYDIYGMEHSTLNSMLQVHSVREPKNYDEKSCKLLNSLVMSIYDVRGEDFMSPSTTSTPPASKKRKRRASATEVTDQVSKAPEPCPILDPESLLVPMEAPNKRNSTAGRINRRRYTCFENRPAPKKMPPLVTPKVEVTSETSETPETSEEKKNKKDRKIIQPSIISEQDIIREKVIQLQLQANSEFKRLVSLSRSAREAYFDTNKDLLGTAPYHSEYEIIEEFHNSEKAQLMSVCNHLIEFIKFVKIDQGNLERMGVISNCILQLKDTI